MKKSPEVLIFCADEKQKDYFVDFLMELNPAIKIKFYIKKTNYKKFKSYEIKLTPTLYFIKANKDILYKHVGCLSLHFFNAFVDTLIEENKKDAK